MTFPLVVSNHSILYCPSPSPSTFASAFVCRGPFSTFPSTLSTIRHAGEVVDQNKRRQSFAAMP